MYFTTDNHSQTRTTDVSVGEVPAHGNQQLDNIFKIVVDLLHLVHSLPVVAVTCGTLLSAIIQLVAKFSTVLGYILYSHT